MLTDNQLNHFQDNGFIIIDDLSERVIPQFLCDYIDELVAASRMKQASIGKAQFNQINTTERGDLIHWVDPKHCDSTITTFLEHIDAIKMDLNRAFYLGLRAYPRANFNQISFPLGSPEIDDSDRDNLLNVFMGMPVSITNLPLNMSAGTYLGFVEGWTFRAAYNEISVSLNLSPLAYSLQAMQWQDVSVAEAWNTISGILDWENALVVA